MKIGVLITRSVSFNSRVSRRPVLFEALRDHVVHPIEPIDQAPLEWVSQPGKASSQEAAIFRIHVLPDRKHPWYAHTRGWRMK